MSKALGPSRSLKRWERAIHSIMCFCHANVPPHPNFIQAGANTMLSFLKAEKHAIHSAAQSFFSMCMLNDIGLVYQKALDLDEAQAGGNKGGEAFSFLLRK